MESIGELQEENGQLQEAVVAHAVIDQAIGVIIAVGRLRPEQGFEVLRTVSQHTNRKLRHVAQQIINWPHNDTLDPDIRTALDHALTHTPTT
ncbi:ANTAR domain-containing protein [Streptomyces sp. NPDC047070]|uniref:ANTAR domain-containing protein n=1 Tax=Streptomyces sp. NPDC047070 TaxID=3154923 RepID=UPI003454FA25